MKPQSLTAEAFRAAANVSRETLERLERYAALLEKWNRAINLVARGSLTDLWRRHMLDSAQLWPLLPATLGAAARLPGVTPAALIALLRYVKRGPRTVAPQTGDAA